MINNTIYDFYNYEFMELGVGASPNKSLFDYYLNLAKIQNSTEILEIGYGTGFLTTLLLENNFYVTAIDRSKEGKIFLEKKCNQCNFYGNLNIENIDIIKYTTQNRFNLIVAADEFMVHFLSLTELEKFIKKINSLLDSDGVFITDIRKKQSDDFGKINLYPLYTYDKELNGVKYINCTSWNILTKDNVVLVHFKYEEINSSGDILKSYIKILRQGMFSVEELSSLANKYNLKLEIKEEISLGYDILFFSKFK